MINPWGPITQLEREWLKAHHNPPSNKVTSSTVDMNQHHNEIRVRITSLAELSDFTPLIQFDVTAPADSGTVNSCIAAAKKLYAISVARLEEAR